MSKQLSQVPSGDQKALTKLSGGVILRELPENDVLKYISVLLDRLAKLYQQPNWTAENSVILAEWVLENYSCEMLETVDKILRRPPKSEGTNWRLTPDTIQNWMETELEVIAMKREHWNHNKKFGDGNNKPIEGLEELYANVVKANLKQHEVKEEIKNMERADRIRRFAPVDTKALEQRDEQYKQALGSDPEKCEPAETKQP